MFFLIALQAGCATNIVEPHPEKAAVLSWFESSTASMVFSRQRNTISVSCTPSGIPEPYWWRQPVRIKICNNKQDHREFVSSTAPSALGDSTRFYSFQHEFPVEEGYIESLDNEVFFSVFLGYPPVAGKTSGFSEAPARIHRQ